MRSTVIQAIETHKIIAILRGIPTEKLIPLAEALYQGGIRLLEITYRADGAVSDEETAANIRALSQHFAGRMFIGAGTVMSPRQVRLTKEAGGCFIISPNTDGEVIQETRSLEMVSIPGALTPSEIVVAHKAGADFVKLFPVTSLGCDYVKAITAPLSHIRLLAVGGINEGNMDAYRRAGVRGFGIGSNITDKTMIANNDWRGIRALAATYTAVIQNG